MSGRGGLGIHVPRTSYPRTKSHVPTDLVHHTHVPRTTYTLSANPLAQDNDGVMPIRRAILNGRNDIVELVLQSMETQAKVSETTRMDKNANDHEMLSAITSSARLGQIKCFRIELKNM